MKLRESLAMARGQIAWILALVVSTAIIIQLERVDFEGQLSLLERNPLAQVAPGSGDAALNTARAALAGASDDPQAQAQMLTALVLAAIADGTDDTLSAEADALLIALPPTSDIAEPVLKSAVAIARTVFAAP